MLLLPHHACLVVIYRNFFRKTTFVWKCATLWYTCLMRDFSKQSWHKRVSSRIIRLHRHLTLYFLLSFLFSLSQGEFQELSCTTLLSCLLFENIFEQISITLYKSLTVNLSVFNLFFSITLYSFHQTVHRLVLFHFELRALSLHLFKCSLFIDFSLDHFLLRTFCPHKLCVVVFFYLKKDFLLIS